MTFAARSQQNNPPSSGPTPPPPGMADGTLLFDQSGGGNPTVNITIPANALPYIDIFAYGGGGGGGGAAYGGGAGGFCYSHRVPVTPGVTVLRCVIGDHGNGASQSPAVTSTAGFATTVNCANPSLSMTAGGGGPGNVNVGQGQGGRASNGWTLNINGGNGTASAGGANPGTPQNGVGIPGGAGGSPGGNGAYPGGGGGPDSVNYSGWGSWGRLLIYARS